MEGKERKRKEEDMGWRLHYELAVWPDAHIYIYIYKQMLGLITCKSSKRIELHLFTGLSISMGSNSNTYCQITASIIASYTSVRTSNRGGVCERGDNVSPLSLTLWQGYTHANTVCGLSSIRNRLEPDSVHSRS